MTAQPRMLDAWQLLPRTFEEMVLDTARDTHRSVATRIWDAAGTRGGTPVAASRLMHDAIAGTVYGSVRLGLRAGSIALKVAGDAGVGPDLDAGPKGRFVRSALNGLVGDRMEAEGSRLAISMTVRRAGADVAPDATSLGRAFPDATGRLVVFLHGLSESEAYWSLRREEYGTAYPESLQARGWTPLMLRANTGRSLRANGVDLSALLRDVVAGWPVPVEQIAIIGHSLGGLVARAACAVGTSDEAPWTDLLTDLVTLGTPHCGAPIASGLTRGSEFLGRRTGTAAFGRAADHRSVAILDLADGLGADVAPLPGVRHRLVSATVTASPRHPVGRFLGDLLVRVPSAYGEGSGPGLFDDADRLHLPGADHFDLLNHPDIHRALEEWLP